MWRPCQNVRPGDIPRAAGLLAKKTGRMVGVGARCHQTSQTDWNWQSGRSFSFAHILYLFIYHNCPRAFILTCFFQSLTISQLIHFFFFTLNLSLPLYNTELSVLTFQFLLTELKVQIIPLCNLCMYHHVFSQTFQNTLWRNSNEKNKCGGLTSLDECVLDSANHWQDAVFMCCLWQIDGLWKTTTLVNVTSLEPVNILVLAWHTKSAGNFIVRQPG